MLLENKKQEIIKKYGDWTAYDIKLSDTCYTMSERSPFYQLYNIVQLIKDHTDGDFSKLRILDLACLEGQYAIEFAQQGATVIGIEGREANVRKALFAKEALGLENVCFYQDDVRNVTSETYGEFDIILCSGILYHLDERDCFDFLENIYGMCKKFAIIDTHICLSPNITSTYNGNSYYGSYYLEHNEEATQEEKLAKAWSSLDNNKSFWFEKVSLIKLLHRIGFNSIGEHFSYNSTSNVIRDRFTFIAYKSNQLQLYTSPITNIYSKQLPEMEPEDVSLLSLINENTRLQQEISIYKEFIHNIMSSMELAASQLDGISNK